MLKFIDFFCENKLDEKTAGILLDDHYEKFSLNLKDWTKDDYIKQWKHAAKYSLENRELSCLIKSYECAYYHVKAINVYTIIPAEMIYSDNRDESFFITESFLFITENAETFNSNEAFDIIKNNFGNYFPIYYFNISRLDKFYLYLSEVVAGISNWKVEKNNIESILTL